MEESKTPNEPASKKPRIKPLSKTEKEAKEYDFKRFEIKAGLIHAGIKCLATVVVCLTAAFIFHEARIMIVENPGRHSTVTVRVIEGLPWCLTALAAAWGYRETKRRHRAEQRSEWHRSQIPGYNADDTIMRVGDGRVVEEESTE